MEMDDEEAAIIITTRNKIIKSPPIHK